MRVGSWPGPSYSHNPFVSNLCESLSLNGVDVIDVSDLDHLSKMDLDLVQLHWAEQIFWGASGAYQKAAASIRALRSLRGAKAQGVRVAWIAHNIRPHRLNGLSELMLWPLLRRGFSAEADCVITMSPETASVVSQAFHLPRGRVAGVRMPRFAAGPGRHVARQALDLAPDIKLFTFFGAVRANKHVDDLIRAFRQTADANLRLTVLGEADEPALYRAMAAGDPRIELRLSYARRSEIEIFAAASEAVILPLGDQLHSSSLLDALCLGSQVVTRDSPFARGLRADVGATWVHLYTGDLASDVFAIKPPRGKPDLSRYELDAVGRELLAVYDQVLAKRGSPSGATSDLSRG